MPSTVAMVTADDVIRLCFGSMMIKVFAVTKNVAIFTVFAFKFFNCVKCWKTRQLLRASLNGLALHKFSLLSD